MNFRQFGLIGYPLEHSFSKKHFQEKFLREGLRDCSYELFPIARIDELPALLTSHPALRGLNVTIPYKKAIIPFLHALHPDASKIGAVNCIQFSEQGMHGYNTDAIAFEQSLKNYLSPSELQDLKAIVFGTGGAASAVVFVLRKLGIEHFCVSRKKTPATQTYADLEEQTLATHRLLINTTPAGMHPEVGETLPIPFELLDSKHILFDLIYNPEKTLFLRHGEKKGCRIKNGLEMLILQAKKSWEIWNR
jgi:shikimate dehydrogenase